MIFVTKVFEDLSDLPQGKVRQRFNKALASFFVHDRFSAIVCFDFDNFDRRQPHFLIHLE